MATCLQVLPMVWSVPPSSLSTPLNSQPLKETSHSITLRCRAMFGRRSYSLIPMSPLNPNDSFLNNRASFGSESPESLNQRRGNSDERPFLNLLDRPPRATKTSGPTRGKPRIPPPDLPSITLDKRIVYIGMPLVPAVCELVFAELMYLQWKNPVDPIYVFIDSAGTIRDDGKKVANEHGGFLLYDTMMSLKNEIRTLIMGCAFGQACLLAAAGTKGQRYMMKYSRALLQQPKVWGTGLMPANDVLIHAKQAKVNRDILVGLLAKHTGNSFETVSEKMLKRYNMTAQQAKEFGVVDHIVDDSNKFDIIRGRIPRGRREIVASNSS